MNVKPPHWKLCAVGASMQMPSSPAWEPLCGRGSAVLPLETNQLSFRNRVGQRSPQLLEEPHAGQRETTATVHPSPEPAETNPATSHPEQGRPTPTHLHT